VRRGRKCAPYINHKIREEKKKMKIKQSTANELMDRIAATMVAGYCNENKGKEEFEIDKEYLENVTREAFYVVCEIIGIDEVVEGV
jgi:hypothetical protein